MKARQPMALGVVYEPQWQLELGPAGEGAQQGACLTCCSWRRDDTEVQPLQALPLQATTVQVDSIVTRTSLVRFILLSLAQHAGPGDVPVPRGHRQNASRQSTGRVWY